MRFEHWDDARPARTCISRFGADAPYEPGAFYRSRPWILGLLRVHDLHPAIIMIDGHVFLHDNSGPGLGKRLSDVRGGRVPMIGVAKTAFVGIGENHALLRRDSTRPLYVTAAGLPLPAAKSHVGTMHGAHRLPTLLKAVDRACRDAAH
jgi:deoxyribonuclease V